MNAFRNFFPLFRRGYLVVSLLLITLFYSSVASATDYYFYANWLWNWWSNLPTCNNGNWSYNNNAQFTCSGSVELQNGDTISASTSITIVISSGTLVLDGNNTIGDSTNNVDLSVTSNSLSANQPNGSGSSVIYGDVTAQGNGLTLKNTSVTGAVTDSSGKVSITGGTISGAVSGNGVFASGATLNSGVNGNSSGVTLTGSTVTGNVIASAGTISIANTTIPSGSVAGGNGVAISVGGSTIGTATNSVSISTNNTINLSTNTTVYGNVTAGTWSSALVIDKSSSVVGVCSSDLNSLTDPGDASRSYDRCSAPTGQCTTPAFVPAGVTCYCDSFNGTNLSSAILNSTWTVSSSGSNNYAPNFTNNRLRLTSAAQNEATSATLGAVFPAAGNYISVEFRQYAYGGNGADGLAMVLSDSYVTPNPGAYGGSLGYAQKTGINGFAGGWLGVGFDEFGNYSNPTEGRIDGPGYYAGVVAARGSFYNDYLHGYPFLGKSKSVAVNNSAGTYYQIIVDARNYTAANHSANVQINTTGCTSDFCPTAYSSLWNVGNIYSLTTTTPINAVPDFWKLSFTGSTGSNYNIHELSGLRICALKIYPANGAVAGAFNAIDSYYWTSNNGVVKNLDAISGDIFTKLVNRSFQLVVAALQTSGGAATGILSGYVTSGSKTVKIQLYDDSNSSSACGGTPIFANPISQVVKYGSVDNGAEAGSGGNGYWLTPNITLSNAYKKVHVKITDGTSSACSTDAFSVRPAYLNFSATGPSSGGQTVATTTVVKAGASFSVSVQASDNNSAIVTSYSGTPVLDSAKIFDGVSFDATSGKSSVSPAPLVCSISAAVSGTATGSCSYGEVGYFILNPYAIVDSSFTAVDQGSGIQDCYTDTASGAAYLNQADGNDKIGCYIATPLKTSWGRFVPDHFEINSVTLNNRAETACSSRNIDGFTYMGEPIQLAFLLTAKNSANSTTVNYDTSKVDSNSTSWARLSGATAANWIASTGGSSVSSASLNLWGASLVAPITTFPSGRILVNGGVVGNCGVPSGSFAAGVGNFSACAQLARGTSPAGPYDQFTLGVAPVDADQVTVLSSALNFSADGDSTNERVAFPATKERFGVLRLLSAYGSELLGLNLPMQALYYTGTGFQLNGLDNCTTVGTANVAATTLGASALSSSLSKLQLSGGQGYLAFTAPSSGGTPVSGSMDVALDLGNVGDSFNTCVTSLQGSTTVTPASMPWLRGFWGPATSCRNAAAYYQDPNARLRFGSSKAPFIYMRERY